MSASKFYAIIAGVGSGTGRSVALKFAESYSIILLSRSPASYKDIAAEINQRGGSAVGIDADASDLASLRTAFARIKEEVGDKQLAAAVYNVGGSFVRKPFLELTPEEFASGFQSNGQGLYNFASLSLPLLLSSVSSSPHPPSLLLTGATASLRGSAQLASFASGKFALRAVGQSLAREFGPKGVHVAHVIIDGVIDIPRLQQWEVNGGAPEGKISSAAIADTYWHLHTQPRSAFTQEIDLRPYVEKF
ncbi:MAG: hypothetical protein M1818_001801 [Claussenomyces sp. TS43310]|nr:MAG: hypothetical protein M1818_001801 [Claussenomyces sp. TS43310]